MIVSTLLIIFLFIFLPMLARFVLDKLVFVYGEAINSVVYIATVSVALSILAADIFFFSVYTLVFGG